MKPIYKLKTGTVARLAYYRKLAEKHGGDWRRWHWRGAITQPSHWRTQSGNIAAYSIDDLPWYQYRDSAHICRDGGYRLVGRPNAYEADCCGHDTIVPGVATLRTSRGRLAVPVIHHTEVDYAVIHMGEAVWLPESEDYDQDVIDEVLLTAHRIAEREAEACREGHAKAEAEAQIAECRATLAGLLEERRRLWSRVRELEADPWTAV